jgi:hypothetical protein
VNFIDSTEKMQSKNVQVENFEQNRGILIGNSEHFSRNQRILISIVWVDGATL